MRPTLNRKSALRGALLLGLLSAAWVLPPAVHQTLHYCPVRPDGVSQAAAVPAFARKYGFACTQCHSNWPTLNEYGRQFKLNGYVPERDGEEGVLKSKDGSMWTEKNFPISAIVRGRPFDQGTRFSGGARDQEFKMEAISDVDMFVAGGDASKHVSWFGEMDANADAGNTWTVQAGDLQLGYHPSEYANLVVARRGFFVMDPYQTLTNFGSPTLTARAVSGGLIADLPPSLVTMDQVAQTIYGYGEAGKDGIGYLYYAGGVSADKGADTGTGGKNGNLRLAFDTAKGLVVGAFGSMGHAGAASNGAAAAANTVADRTAFKRYGVDVLVEKGPVAGRAAYLWTYDHDVAVNDAALSYPNANAKESNRAAYVEAQYNYARGDSKVPFLVPLVRQNYYTSRNGTRRFGYFTAQLAHYFAPNVKSYVEGSWDTKQDPTVASSPVRQPKGRRLVLGFEVGF